MKKYKDPKFSQIVYQLKKKNGLSEYQMTKQYPQYYREVFIKNWEERKKIENFLRRLEIKKRKIPFCSSLISILELDINSLNSKIRKRNRYKLIAKRLGDKKWKEKKDQIENERGNKCQFCNKLPSESNIYDNLCCCHILHPEDHMDVYNILNYADWNILLLCRSCHKKFDTNQIIEVEF